jgi:hypothetical protein
MDFFNSADDLMFHLKTTSSAEAKRLWRHSIKEKWNYQCAYCGSNENLTIDHVIPQSKGGIDITTNVVCCCVSCNQSKAHSDWEEWYSGQYFFSEEKKKVIEEWVGSMAKKNSYRYKQRKNIVYSKNQ